MNGLIYIAFGIEYDKMLAHCLFYSRRYTNLPIVVLTNLKEDERHQRWKDVCGIEFKFIDKPQVENRDLKTSINKYSPFDKTLYLDADCVIQNSGIERVFKSINESSIVLNVYGRWNETKHINSLYRNHFNICGCTLPMDIYYGALVGFGKSEKIDTFFSNWNRFWNDTGSGRDMPSLACAAKKSGVNIVELNNNDKFFTWIPRKNYTIQHEYGQYLRQIVGCPDFKVHKPFDIKPFVNKEACNA